MHSECGEDEGSFSSATNEWATPMDLFSRIAKEYGPFDLDPCCTAKTAKAAKFFTIADDGLAQDWGRNTVFMNSPYGHAIKHWIKKAYEESFKCGCRVVCLIPSRTDTRWWYDYCMKADLIVLFKGRIKFECNDGRKAPAPFPSCLVIFNEKSIDKPTEFVMMKA